MPLERRGTQNWLRPAQSNMSEPSDVAIAEYPSHSMKKTGTTKQAVSTNHKPEPHVGRLPSVSTKLATPLIIYCSSFVPFCGWLLTFLVCHWKEVRHRISYGQRGPMCLRNQTSPHYTTSEHAFESNYHDQPHI
uniref:PIR Superfamily Protein n=1 Tax=Mesocestoides corti TaxID=53468 RepID=A0A5K3FXK6_MESCO